MNTVAALSLATIASTGFCSQALRDGEAVSRSEPLELHIAAIAEVTGRVWSYGDVQVVLLEDGEERRLPGRQHRAVVASESGPLRIMDVFLFQGTTFVSTYLGVDGAALPYEIRVRRGVGEETVAQGVASLVGNVWTEPQISLDNMDDDSAETPEDVGASTKGATLRIGLLKDDGKTTAELSVDPVTVKTKATGDGEPVVLEGALLLEFQTPGRIANLESDGEPFSVYPCSEPVLGEALAKCWTDGLDYKNLKAYGSVWMLRADNTLGPAFVAITSEAEEP